MLNHFNLQIFLFCFFSFLTPSAIKTWEELPQKFLTKYFLPAKVAKLRYEIIIFTQWDNEILYEVLEHFKDLLTKCPHHDLLIWLHIQTFYNGLGATNLSIIDAIARGPL